MNQAPHKQEPSPMINLFSMGTMFVIFFMIACVMFLLGAVPFFVLVFSLLLAIAAFFFACLGQATNEQQNQQHWQEWNQQCNNKLDEWRNQQ